MNEVDKIVDALQHEILSGEIPIGATLPPFRKLAEQFGVTLPTAQRAVARVKELGLVEVRQGSGARVLPLRKVAHLGVLPKWVSSLRSRPKEASTILADFLELRTQLLTDVVSGFHALTEEEKETLKDRVSGLARAENAQDAMEFDLEIADTLLTARDNLAYILLFNTLKTLLNQLPELQTAMYAAPAQNASAYRVVFAALEAGSLESITPIMKTAITAVDDLTIERFENELEKS